MRRHTRARAGCPTVLGQSASMFSGRGEALLLSAPEPSLGSVPVPDGTMGLVEGRGDSGFWIIHAERST